MCRHADTSFVRGALQRRQHRVAVGLVGRVGLDAPLAAGHDLERRDRDRVVVERRTPALDVVALAHHFYLVAAHRRPYGVGSTKLSITFLVPALSKSISSRSASTARTVP